MPLTIITEIQVYLNELATKRYQQYADAGLGWIGRNVIAQLLFEIGEEKDIRLFLDSQLPEEIKMDSKDPKSGWEFKIVITSRKLGEDHGKSQLIDISNYLMGIRDYIRNVSRRPTKEEHEKIMKIVSSPFPK